MKKLALSFIACLISLTIQAQNTEHLKFMGIPIDGKLNKFKKELVNKGLRCNKFRDSYSFEGYFSGENAYIYPLVDGKTNNVYAVGVIIDCHAEDIARGKYLNFVRNLTEKYHAMSFDDLAKLFKEDPYKFYENVKSGEFNEFNIINDSIENKTTFEISKVLEQDSHSSTIKNPVELAHYLVNNTGNIGMIIVDYYRREDPSEHSQNRGYAVSVVYRDKKNTDNQEKHNQDDL